MAKVLILIGMVLFVFAGIIAFGAFYEAPTLDDDDTGGFWPYGKNFDKDHTP